MRRGLSLKRDIGLNRMSHLSFKLALILVLERLICVKYQSTATRFKQWIKVERISCVN